MCLQTCIKENKYSAVTILNVTIKGRLKKNIKNRHERLSVSFTIKSQTVLKPPTLYTCVDFPLSLLHKKYLKRKANYTRKWKLFQVWWKWKC